MKMAMYNVSPFSFHALLLAYVGGLRKSIKENQGKLALMDYVHDASLLQNNVDNSINFQLASGTLDSCPRSGQAT